MLNFNEPATTDTTEAAEAMPASPERGRTTAITPLEMRQTTFATGMRGYSRESVRSFLVEASESYELALRENERLRHDIERLQGSLRQYQDLEGGLKSTLVHAQKVADDVRANATQEAERIVKEAQGRAELMMMAAQNRVEDAQREIDGLRLRRREAEANVEAIISSLNGTLEFIRDQQRDSRVVPLRAAI
jgi:cell division initiation protein